MKPVLHSQPPIAEPDASIATPSVLSSRVWSNAPRAVRVARFTNIISLIGFVLWAVWAAAQSDMGQWFYWKTFETSLGLGPPVAENMDLLLLIFGLVCLTVAGVHGWLVRACERGISAGWEMQILASILGLFLVPIGTLIHGYILSQWFKPEVKRWFGPPSSPEPTRRLGL